MSAELSFALSFLAGLVAFLSPCILPVIPSYITLLSGIGYRDLAAGRYDRRRVLAGSVSFVLGFSLVFVVLGVVFSTTGSLLGGFSSTVNRIAGAIVIVFGLNYIFDLLKILQIEKRLHLSSRPRGFVGSFVIGATFGAGWTPCIGPVLSTVLILAGTSGQTIRGAAFLMAFSLGLGLPFVLFGLFFARSQKLLKRLKRRMIVIKRIGGVFMILIGILIFDGSLLRFNGILFGWASVLERWNVEYPIAAKAVSIIPLLAVVGLAGFGLYRRYRQTWGQELEGTGYSDSAGQAVMTVGFLVPRIVLIVVLTAGSIGIMADLLRPYELISKWFSFTGL